MRRRASALGMGRIMANPKARVETADREAAEWHERLGARSVTTETIRAFFDWRASPANADAYRRVEMIWTESRKLSGQPEIAEALTDAMSRRLRKTPEDRTSRPLMGLVAISATAALVIGGWTWWQARSTFATGVGEQWVVQLADGSSVRLDTDSRLKVRFSDGQRLVDLERGQAMFTVAHDARRPFVVTAGDARVTAVGTVFDVQRQGAGVSVTLVNGAVDVTRASAADKPLRLAAGQEARVTAAGTVRRPVDVPTAISWTEGRIVFRDTPMREAVAEVNRYLTDKIVLEAPRLSTVPVNGVFKTGDRDAFVSAASGAFGLEASAGPGGSIRLSERGK